MPTTSQEAFRLARGFRELAVALGAWRFAHWDALTSEERHELEDAEWSLLNASSDMITRAVGLTLDEAEADLARLEATTAQAKAAVERLDSVRATIEVATAAVGLAAAIVARDAGAVGRNLKTLYRTMPRAATGPAPHDDDDGA
jgi:hypothetical protein